MPSYDKRKSKSGTDWTVRFRIRENGQDRQIRLSGNKTKADAENAYYMYRTHHPEQFDRSRSDRPYTFGQLIELYLHNRKSNGTKESGYITAASKIYNHITPHFSSMPISDITPAYILKWQNDIMKGYSYSYRSDIRRYLNSIYIFGNRYYEINNVASRVEMPRRPAEEFQKDQDEPFRVWSPEQCTRYLNAINRKKHDILYHFVKLLYFTGMRKGEAIALGPSDINPAGKIRINKSYTRKTKGAPYKITPPKTPTSNRTINAPPELCEELLSLVKSPDDMFIFGNTYPISENTIYKQFKSYIRATDPQVPDITLHELRHSCASLMISNGVSVVAVSHHLGHSSIEQTLKTYAHLMPSDDDQIRNAFSAFPPLS